MNCNSYKNCREPTKNNPLMNLLPRQKKIIKVVI